MFNVEEVKGFKINGGFTEKIQKPEKIITPENLSAILDSLNSRYKFYKSKTEFDYFCNGYAVSEDGKLICHENGTIFEVKEGLNEETCAIKGDFHCNRAKAEITYLEDFIELSGVGFVDEKGKITTHTPYDDCKCYGDGLAPVREKGKDCYKYIDIDDNTVSDNRYKIASCFYSKTAVVYTLDGKWEIIDTNFKTIMELEKGLNLAIFYNNMAESTISNNIRMEQSINGSYLMYRIYNKETKLSTFIDGFIDEMAQKFEINITGQTEMERLISLVCTLASQGTYILSDDELDIYEVEPVVGTKIINEKGESIISYEETIETVTRKLEKKQ